MNFSRIFFAVFLCAAFAVCFPAKFYAAENWISVSSENFHLVGNADEAQMRRTAAKLEQFRHVFTRLFPEFKFVSPIPTNVIVLKDENALTPFKPLTENGQTKDWVKGFFLPDRDVNYIVLAADGGEDYTTIFHEYVHFLVDNTLGRSLIPPWFNEGLAEYYEQFQIENDRRVTLGNVNRAHLALLQKDVLMPLEKFFAIDYYALNRQPKENVISFYAQAWALTHFLMHTEKGARSRQPRRYAELVVSEKSVREAFAEAFRTDYAAMEKDLKKYLERKKFETSVSDLDKTFSVGEISKAFPISDAEAKAFQGDLLLRGNRTTEAAVLLEESLKLDSNSSFANTSYGLLKIKEKKYSEAKKYLEKSVAGASQNYFAFFNYAYLLSREGMTDFGFVIGYDAASAEKIRDNLRKAIALNPAFAESYQLYAFINTARNENLDEGIVMIEKALEIAPGNQIYILRRAELLMRKREFAEARQITQKIIQTATDDKLKLYAASTLNLINNWEAQLKEIEEQKKRPRENPAATDKILSEEEIQKLNARAMLESLNQALRRPKPNEKRLLGFLNAVDCENENVIYSVKSGEQIVKMQSSSVEDVFLMSFEANLVNLQFGCHLSKNERFAVITYRPNADLRSKIAGEIIAIEFVPKTFVFLDVSQIKDRTHF